MGLAVGFADGLAVGFADGLGEGVGLVCTPLTRGLLVVGTFGTATALGLTFSK